MDDIMEYIDIDYRIIE